MREHTRPLVPWKPFVISALLLAGCHNAYHDAVIQNIRGHSGDLSACVADAERANPALKTGEIDLALQIDPSGRVLQTATPKDEVGDPGLSGCIKNKALTWQMPAPSSGKTEVVVYKFRAHGG